MEKWDLSTWTTEILPFNCPVDYFESAWAISDHELVFVSSESVWSFTLDYGFRKIDDWPSVKVSSGSALISKDYVECLEQASQQEGH